jgi:hypothetical protein
VFEFIGVLQYRQSLTSCHSDKRLKPFKSVEAIRAYTKRGMMPARGDNPESAGGRLRYSSSPKHVRTDAGGSVEALFLQHQRRARHQGNVLGLGGVQTSSARPVFCSMEEIRGDTRLPHQSNPRQHICDISGWCSRPYAIIMAKPSSSTDVLLLYDWHNGQLIRHVQGKIGARIFRVNAQGVGSDLERPKPQIKSLIDGRGIDACWHPS